MKYLICSTPGSGASWLCSLLESTGIAGHPASHLEPADDVLGEDELRGCPVVWLRRRDVLARAISSYRAMRTTGVRHLAGAPPEDDSLDRGELYRHFARLAETDEELWPEWFRSMDIEPLEVWYEDLAEDPAQTVSSVCRSLGLGEPGEVPVDRVERQRDETGDAWYATLAPELLARELARTSPVFCMSPWVHLQVPPRGDVRLCCESDTPIGNLREGDTLASAWNSDEMRDVRRRMLAGERVDACRRCYGLEELGRPSYRRFFNTNFIDHAGVVNQTRPDGRLDELNIRFLDVRFSNHCNLTCRMCGPGASTAWHKDAVALGRIPKDWKALILAGDDQALLEEVLSLSPQLELIHFGGGEPLFMDQHYTLLEQLLARGHDQVHLRYNTNFTRLRVKDHDAIELWKRFPNVKVEASLDGSWARGDYLRHGEDWSEIVANRERLRRECPHVEFQIHATVSALNVIHLPSFYREWVDAGYVEPTAFEAYPLSEPRWMNMKGLPEAFKRIAEREYRELIDDYLPRIGITEADDLTSRFEAIVRFMWSEQLDTLDAFRTETRKLDELRGESFVEAFPELAPLMG